MKEDQILLRATRMIGRRKFADAIRLLEPEVVRYHDSFQFYYLLGNACLRSGDFGGALTYFRRAREMKPAEPNVLIGLAALHLRRGETDRVVELCLEALEKEPKNRRARKTLAVIRKSGDPESIGAFIESGRFEKLYPPIPKPPLSALTVIAGTAALAIVAGAAFMGLSFFNVIKAPAQSKSGRTGVDSVVLESGEKKTPVEAGGAYRYVLTKKEIVDEFETARRLFLAYRDEAAKVHINRLLESNAAVSVKQKARLLADYAVVPGFDTIKDRYAYAVVSKEPALYRDVHVVWRGMATNLKEGNSATDFDLLVGYDTRSSLEGIVPVHFDMAIRVDVEKPLEVLGRVVLSGERIRLAGTAVHQSSSIFSKPEESKK